MNMLPLYEVVWNEIASPEERARNAREPMPFILAKLVTLGQMAGEQLAERPTWNPHAKRR